MEATGIISVRGLKIYAYHGVFPQERVLGNHYQVDISLQYPISSLALEKDDLEGTLNYAQVVETVKQVMEIPSNLLENVAFRLKEALLSQFPLISGGSITVAKLNPPIVADIDSVAVTINF